MSGLLVFQISFLIFFFIKRLNPIKSYMLNFIVSDFKPNKAFPPRKNGDKKRHKTHKPGKFKNNELVLEDIDNEDKKENLKEELKEIIKKN